MSNPNQKGPHERSEAEKKAAETRGHESLNEAGKKGGEQSHGSSRKSDSDKDNEE